ncbi:uncharacterized protein BDZ99DRAFT_576707 [Mytilinidion resinicola]|uniref:Uncharacterized protein n=1 Tax=Mytilinidion resinicola TaxID=574789 RepID=A0A6A6Y1Q3_9PEZI|nr:uncharacterized protein BDZ99DRAFT_576707 [Mytilinidion resinicola]KAF2802569.1 hypothetical protein BDZ99DRAFT_576707 [Mytilinidion resinicola]
MPSSRFISQWFRHEILIGYLHFYCQIYFCALHPLTCTVETIYSVIQGFWDSLQLVQDGFQGIRNLVTVGENEPASPSTILDELFAEDSTTTSECMSPSSASTSSYIETLTNDTGEQTHLFSDEDLTTCSPGFRCHTDVFSATGPVKSSKSTATLLSATPLVSIISSLTTTSSHPTNLQSTITASTTSFTTSNSTGGYFEPVADKLVGTWTFARSLFVAIYGVGTSISARPASDIYWIAFSTIESYIRVWRYILAESWKFWREIWACTSLTEFFHLVLVKLTFCDGWAGCKSWIANPPVKAFLLAALLFILAVLFFAWYLWMYERSGLVNFAEHSSTTLTPRGVGGGSGGGGGGGSGGGGRGDGGDDENDDQDGDAKADGGRDPSPGNEPAPASRSTPLPPVQGPLVSAGQSTQLPNTNRQTSGHQRSEQQETELLKALKAISERLRRVESARSLQAQFNNKTVKEMEARLQHMVTVSGNQPQDSPLDPRKNKPVISLRKRINELEEGSAQERGNELQSIADAIDRFDRDVKAKLAEVKASVDEANQQFHRHRMAQDKQNREERETVAKLIDEKMNKFKEDLESEITKMVGKAGSTLASTVTKVAGEAIKNQTETFQKETQESFKQVLQHRQASDKNTAVILNASKSVQEAQSQLMSIFQSLGTNPDAPSVPSNGTNEFTPAPVSPVPRPVDPELKPVPKPPSSKPSNTKQPAKKPGRRQKEQDTKPETIKPKLEPSGVVPKVSRYDELTLKPESPKTPTKPTNVSKPPVKQPADENESSATVTQVSITVSVPAEEPSMGPTPSKELVTKTPSSSRTDPPASNKTVGGKSAEPTPSTPVDESVKDEKDGAQSRKLTEIVNAIQSELEGKTTATPTAPTATGETPMVDSQNLNMVIEGVNPGAAPEPELPSPYLTSKVKQMLEVLVDETPVEAEPSIADHTQPIIDPLKLLLTSFAQSRTESKQEPPPPIVTAFPPKSATSTQSGTFPNPPITGGSASVFDPNAHIAAFESGSIDFGAGAPVATPGLSSSNSTNQHPISSLQNTAFTWQLPVINQPKAPAGEQDVTMGNPKRIWGKAQHRYHCYKVRYGGLVQCQNSLPLTHISTLHNRAPTLPGIQAKQQGLSPTQFQNPSNGPVAVTVTDQNFQIPPPGADDVDMNDIKNVQGSVAEASTERQGEPQIPDTVNGTIHPDSDFSPIQSPTPSPETIPEASPAVLLLNKQPDPEYMNHAQNTFRQRLTDIVKHNNDTHRNFKSAEGMAINLDGIIMQFVLAWLKAIALEATG